MEGVRQLRNIGVIAHIDAGKTTTTERMLYYSKKIRSLGDVDDGDTTMDFLEEERQRGITIKAACITFEWNGHKVNLIDTPGHVDFTIEVERCLRVLDGAIGVFDGVKGVEAQSETVWKQADRYKVPRLAFVNKMDREGASLPYAVHTLRTRLGINPLVIHMPIGESSSFSGVINLINMTKILYNNDATGNTFTVSPLDEHETAVANVERAKLIEQVAELNEAVGEAYLNSNCDTSMNAIPPQLLKSALRQITINMTGVVVLCGSSLKNKNVQSLLDAVVDFLPAPCDSPPLVVSLLDQKSKKGLSTSASKSNRSKSNVDTNSERTSVVRIPDAKGPLCALAFKVSHDSQRGAVVFVRVFSGVLRVKDSLLNVNASIKKASELSIDLTNANLSKRMKDSADVKEKVLRLMEISADSTVDISEVTAGNIAAIVGLKNTRTGDTLIAANDPERIQLSGIKIPEPVFFCAIESESSAEEEKLQAALKACSLDDPSIQVVDDKDSGQLLLKGMGELHLEVFHNKLKRDYKVDCQLGKMNVSYRETIRSSVRQGHEQSSLINQTASTGSTISGGNSSGSNSNAGGATAAGAASVANTSGPVVRLEFELNPADRGAGNSFNVELESADESMDESIPAEVEEVIRKGVEIGLMRGPLMSYAVRDVNITLINISTANNNNDTASQIECTPAYLNLFQACAINAISKGLGQGDPCLMEPVMDLEVSVPGDKVGVVISDLSGKRRGNIREVQSTADKALAAAANVSLNSPSSAATSSSSSSSSSTSSSFVAPNQIVTCEAPLAEMMGYSSALRSVTQGLGSFTMTFSSFREVPSHIQTKIMKANTW
jgi:elongation factor G